jgi:hypothetical protein
LTATQGSAQGTGESNRLEWKRDSLERAIRRGVLTSEDKQQLSQCARTQRQFLEEARKKNPEVARVDSLLRAVKLKGVGPDDPEAMRLMQKKYSFEQGFDNAWSATAEGKRCLSADVLRRKREEKALAEHAGYQKVLAQLKQQGLL